jgi:hypothetical protein
MNKAFIIGRVSVSTCMQAHGAPLVDRAYQTDQTGNRYEGFAILLQPWKRNQYRESLPQRALVIGWRQ